MNVETSSFSPEEKISNRIVREALFEHSPVLLLNKFLEESSENVDKLIDMVENRLREYSLRSKLMIPFQVGREFCYLLWDEDGHGTGYCFHLEFNQHKVRTRLKETVEFCKREVSKSLVYLVNRMLSDLEMTMTGSHTACSRDAVGKICLTKQDKMLDSDFVFESMNS